MKTRILLAVIMMVCMTSLRVPTRIITGRVTSVEDGTGLPGVNVLEKGTTNGTVTDGDGNYKLEVSHNGATLVISFIGFNTEEVSVGERVVIDVSMEPDTKQLAEVVVTGQAPREESRALGYSVRGQGHKAKRRINACCPEPPLPNTEEYAGIAENTFRPARQNPLSTFSIDVDAASYSNVRRFLRDGQKPPVDAVRTEEMVNYFDYNYADPKGEDPFSIYTEISSSPWNEKHKLVHIGLQGKRMKTENLPPSNLVFLIDVSGSMQDPVKLPLVKSSLLLLVAQLREKDRIAIVVYAGAAGLVLKSTSGNNKEEILTAIDRLQAGGSTAGGAGIRLAYDIARKNFQDNGNNRVILATDGDFNVGESSDKAMENLIEEERGDGIFLTVLGYGMGNYKDSKMEILADKGNGNYAYIDNILEAQKVLVKEFGGTLFTIAKDVKLQVEFNPAKVKAWRLIGYENRLLKDEDFNNDKKDAGELGAGHTVTALYEVVPVGVESDVFKIDDLKYQKLTNDPPFQNSEEWMTIKFRYKAPQGKESKLIVQPVKDVAIQEPSENYRWSAAVAAFAMLLRDSEYRNGYSYSDVINLAETSRGEDKEGYRAEFIALVKKADRIRRN